MAKSNRTLVVVMSDSHSGFVAGLLNPEVTLYHEDRLGRVTPYTPKLTPTQEYLWPKYLEYIEEVKALAGKDEIVFFHNGDLCHGNKHKDLLVSNRMSDQISIGQANLEPMFNIKNVKTARIVIGTQAHNFEFGSAELMVSQNMAAKYPKMDVAPGYHYRTTVKGAILDIAHHGPYTGSREWLKGNVARYYLTDILFRDAFNKKEPPDMVLRAHFHRYVAEKYHFEHKWHNLIITPSMCFLGDFVHQAARSPDRVTTGIIAFEIIDGKICEIYDHMMETSDIRTEEIIE